MNQPLKTMSTIDFSTNNHLVIVDTVAVYQSYIVDICRYIELVNGVL